CKYDVFYNYVKILNLMTLGIDAFFPIIRGATTLNEAMDIKNAQKNMKNTAEQVFRLIDISSLME
ncbi:glycerate kinase, partial [[Eubacterium] rectale]|uniref:glycerate kinase n=1 Tax=Agathobacter rectalis TaxID=39491 RepID=UPI0015701818